MSIIKKRNSKSIQDSSKSSTKEIESSKKQYFQNGSLLYGKPFNSQWNKKQITKHISTSSKSSTNDSSWKRKLTRKRTVQYPQDTIVLQHSSYNMTCPCLFVLVKSEVQSVLHSSLSYTLPQAHVWCDDMNDSNFT